MLIFNCRIRKKIMEKVLGYNSIYIYILCIYITHTLKYTCICKILTVDLQKETLMPLDREIGTGKYRNTYNNSVKV